MAQGYDSVLNALPEPLRPQLRYGDMMAGRVDDAWQLIPTKWVVEAQKRWVERKAKGFGPVECVGVGPARGGADQTALALRCGNSIKELVRRKGKDTPDGQSVVNLFLPYGPVPTNVDVIGIGSSVYDTAKLMNLSHVKPVIVSAGTKWRDQKLPALKFTNVRAAALWKVRHWLDPEAGAPDTRLALPPDPELLADLTAPRYALRVNGVAVESKDDIKERIGRSTDVGDAVALACWDSGGKAFIEFIATPSPLGTPAWARG